MTHEKDFIGQLESYLDEYEGATPLPETVRDAVRAEIPATKQVGPPTGPMRYPSMSSIPLAARYGLAAAVVLAAAVIGAAVLNRGENVGGPGPVDSPSPTMTPAPTATPAGLLPEGRHVLSEAGAGVPMTVTIPAPDWYGEPGGGILQKNDFSDAPDGAGMIVFTEGEYYVYGDPCQWSTTRPESPATTVDELVAALRAQASRDASAPVDVTVDGYAGQSITLHVPDDAVFSECDQSTFGSWGLEGSDPAPYRYHQDPGQIDKLWIVDVDGEVVVIDIGHYEGTPQSVIDELEAIVASTTFE